ncbi:hypothetical protein TNCT_115351, partial [Trichonephila clavata]
MDFSPAVLLQDPRLTTDYEDPCEKHQDMEGLLTKAISYRTCFQQLLEHAQENPRPGNPPTYDTDRITQHQKDIATVDILIERIQGELASSYPCPNTDCYAHNKTPDLTHLEDGLFIWHHTDTTRTPSKTRSDTKKKTDKEGFTSPTKTKKLKLTDHPNVSTENPIPLSN